MSAIPSRPFPVKATEPIFPLSVEQYHAMIGAGVLTDDDPAELLEGVLAFKTPKNPPHIYVVESADAIVSRMLGQGWFYRRQEPVTLGDGEPEPDGIVVRGSRQEYRSKRVTAADVALVIEVADSTLPRDRGVKLRSYARAGIPCYWIINLQERCVEVYSKADSTASEPTYRERNVVAEADTIGFVIEGKELGRILVRELFE